MRKDEINDFQKCKTIDSYGKRIYIDELTLKDALEEQVYLKTDIAEFKKSTKKQVQKKKEQKSLTLNNSTWLLKRRQKNLNGFESKTFPTGKETKGKILKIIIFKEMLQK